MPDPVYKYVCEAADRILQQRKTARIKRKQLDNQPAVKSNNRKKRKAAMAAGLHGVGNAMALGELDRANGKKANVFNSILGKEGTGVGDLDVIDVRACLIFVGHMYLCVCAHGFASIAQ